MGKTKILVPSVKKEADEEPQDADYVSILLKKDGEEDIGIVFTCLASKQFSTFVAEARSKLVEHRKITEHQDIQVLVGSNRAIEKPGRLMWNVRHDNHNKDGNPFMLASYVILGQAKPSINIVVIGHVNSGKSTTIDHLICKLGSLDKKEMDMITQEAVAANKASMRYAWVLDKLKAERERDYSIDLSLWKFETNNFCCTVTDAPGHCDFIKNMITGTSLADCAVLVIDSTALGFNAGLSKKGQTREHALLAFTLGVNQMICCCNKIDATTPGYSMVRYDEIVLEVSSFLKKVGYKLDRIPFIPMSGLEGDNIIERSANLDWYKGPTLLEAIESIQEPKRPFDKPLRIPIQQTYRIGGIGCVTVGRVQSGVLKPGMDMTFGPTALTAEVRSVNDHPQLFYEAGPGEDVAFNLKRTDPNNLKRGDVGSNSEDDPVKAATSFVSQVIVTGHPGLVQPGYTPVMSCHTSTTSVKFAELLSKVDRQSGKELEKEPKFLKVGDAGMVKMIPTKPVVVETFCSYPPLGRFAVRDMKQTVAVGVIKSVER